MYPSLIISRNICFTTRDDRGTIVSPLGVHFLSKEQQPGILPSILADLMRRRDETKSLAKKAKDPEEAHYYDGLQGAIKILMTPSTGCSPHRSTGSPTAPSGKHNRLRQGDHQSIIKSLSDDGFT